jgi:hypothetical protein
MKLRLQLVLNVTSLANSHMNTPWNGTLHCEGADPRIAQQLVTMPLCL